MGLRKLGIQKKNTRSHGQVKNHSFTGIQADREADQTGAKVCVSAQAYIRQHRQTGTCTLDEHTQVYIGGLAKAKVKTLVLYLTPMLCLYRLTHAR